MAVELKPANEVDFGAYVTAFNHAYHGYFVPIILNQNALHALVKRDSIHLASSVAAMIGNRIVGIGMLAMRPPQGWIGGVGVIPMFRRRGIARQIMEYLIQKAEAHALESVGLEVFTQNVAACQLYHSLGFESERRLLILERPSEPVTLVAGYRVQSRAPRYALSFYQAFHDIPNAWQRSLAALHDLSPHLQAWTIASEKGADGVLGYGVGWLGSDGFHLMDIATTPNSPERFAVAQALVGFIHHTTELAGHLVNIGENDAATPPLLALGYQEKMSQYEMRLKL